MKHKDFKNKKVVVAGLGITGISAVKYLLKHGAKVAVRDKNDEAGIYERISELKKYGYFDVLLGKSYLSELYSYDAVVLSPGINPFIKEIVELKKRGISIYNDVALFLEDWEGRGATIGVTGSNGKSTTASLIHTLFQLNGFTSKLGGSIGVSPLNWLDDMNKEDIAILETGSALLECFGKEHYFDIVVCTNISSNHLDRYPGGIEEYAKVKLSGIKTGHTTCIVNIDDEGIKKFILPFLDLENVIPVSADKLKIEKYKKGLYLDQNCAVAYVDSVRHSILLHNINDRLLPGTHNIYNILAAFAVVSLFKNETAKNDIAIREFTGLKHRIQYVATVDGVKFFNDSKSTSPDATKKAIEVVSQEKQGGNIVLIAGGDDKDMNFSGLEFYFTKNVHSVILLPGSASLKIEKLIVDTKCKCALYKVQNMEEAVFVARRASQKGDVVLLSPSAGSHSQFINFEDRGDCYVTEIKKYVKSI